MITENELKAVDDLRKTKLEITGLINSLSSQYVKASIGIVDINSANKSNPIPSDHAFFFNNNLPELKNELNNNLLSSLKHKLKETELELSKYITSSDI